MAYSYTNYTFVAVQRITAGSVLEDFWGERGLMGINRESGYCG